MCGKPLRRAPLPPIKINGRVAARAEVLLEFGQRGASQRQTISIRSSVFVTLTSWRGAAQGHARSTPVMPSVSHAASNARCTCSHGRERRSPRLIRRGCRDDLRRPLAADERRDGDEENDAVAHAHLRRAYAPEPGHRGRKSALARFSLCSSGTVIMGFPFGCACAVCVPLAIEALPTTRRPHWLQWYACAPCSG